MCRVSENCLSQIRCANLGLHRNRQETDQLFGVMPEKVSADDVQLALPASIATPGNAGAMGSAGSNATLAVRTEAFEKEVLLAELRRHNFHMTNVARAVGLERSHLYKKCQQLGIDLQTLRRPE